MALVRVRKDGLEFNVGAAYAEAHDLEVIDSPTRDDNGRPRRPTRANDRPRKARKSVDEAAAEKGAKSPAKPAGKAATTADGNTNPPSTEENQS